MSSLVIDLNSSTAQKTVNWVTTANFAVGKFVQTHRNCRQLVANCDLCTHRRRDLTRQLSRVGVGDSAVCIGH